jgi:alkanesulfonate monooxygenase SsuD/methylene tetrahydromethanopterin reductase-like flavin-dependent oxidoreductase (luciferase family)
MAGVMVLAADTDDEAQAQFVAVRRWRTATILGRPRDLPDDEADRLLETPAGQHAARMMRYAATGTPAVVARELDEFVRLADADELIVLHGAPTVAGRLRSLDLVADLNGQPGSSMPVPAQAR